MSTRRRIVALTKYGQRAASTRQRFLQFRPALAEAGFDLSILPLLDDAHVSRLAEGRRSALTKVAAAYVARIRDLHRLRSPDLLWLHYELFPYFPAFAEKGLLRVGSPIVYDFDDAIFHMYDRPRVAWLLRDKMAPLLRAAAAVTAGNSYLADYAARFNDRVSVFPTIVDTSEYVPGKSSAGPPTIGWIGSPSTWRYVRPLLGVLRDFCMAGKARLLVIGAGPLTECDVFRGAEYRTWSEVREIADVQDMDIGIMPLPDEPWARGKCGYKIIQYMACGLPSVASPVGVNRDIVVDGVTGLLASCETEWRRALERLLRSAADRQVMGQAARARAVEHYSLSSQAPRLIKLFRSIVRE